MEAIDVDLRGIAILYLADRFKKLYIKWGVHGFSILLIINQSFY